jgi:hypothetical protein
VRTPVVVGEDLDVLVTVTAVELVLEAKIGEMDRLVGLYATLPISRTYLTASLLFVRSIPSKVNR